MLSLEELKKEIDEIKARNKNVEADKAWETSWTRKFLIVILTYIVVVIFFTVSNLGNPFVNSIVPTIGFMLSTLTVPLCKKWWLKKRVTSQDVRGFDSLPLRQFTISEFLEVLRAECVVALTLILRS